MEHRTKGRKLVKAIKDIVRFLWFLAVLAIFCIAMFVLAMSGFGAHFPKLRWDANNDFPDGYKLYIGTNSRVYYASNIVIGWTNTTSGFDNLPDGTYYFAATAWKRYGEIELESFFSEELVAPLPPRAPTGLSITNVLFLSFTNNHSTIVEWSPNLETWRTDAPSSLLQISVAVDPSRMEAQFWKVR